MVFHIVLLYKKQENLVRLVVVQIQKIENVTLEITFVLVIRFSQTNFSV